MQCQYQMTCDREGQDVPYCGTIVDILEVDFGSFTCVVLEVKWDKSIITPRTCATMVMSVGSTEWTLAKCFVPRHPKDSDTSLSYTSGPMHCGPNAKPPTLVSCGACMAKVPEALFANLM